MHYFLEASIQKCCLIFNHHTIINAIELPLRITRVNLAYSSAKPLHSAATKIHLYPRISTAPLGLKQSPQHQIWHARPIGQSINRLPQALQDNHHQMMKDWPRRCFLVHLNNNCCGNLIKKTRGHTIPRLTAASGSGRMIDRAADAPASRQRTSSAAPPPSHHTALRNRVFMGNKPCSSPEINTIKLQAFCRMHRH